MGVLLISVLLYSLIGLLFVTGLLEAHWPWAFVLQYVQDSYFL